MTENTLLLQLCILLKASQNTRTLKVHSDQMRSFYFISSLVCVHTDFFMNEPRGVNMRLYRWTNQTQAENKAFNIFWCILWPPTLTSLMK